MARLIGPSKSYLAKVGLCGHPASGNLPKCSLPNSSLPSSVRGILAGMARGCRGNPHGFSRGIKIVPNLLATVLTVYRLIELIPFPSLGKRTESPQKQRNRGLKEPCRRHPQKCRPREGARVRRCKGENKAGMSQSLACVADGPNRACLPVNDSTES